MIALLLGPFFCWLALHALGNLGLLSEGAQVQLALPNLTQVLDTAVIEGDRLQLETALEPLASVVLLITTTPTNPTEETEVVTLSGFISPSGDDIMVTDADDKQGHVSLRGWLRTMYDVTFILQR